MAAGRKPLQPRGSFVKKYDVPAGRKMLRLIELLAQSAEPLGTTEIAERLNLNKHMTFRLLQTLADEGWILVEPEGPKYRLSLKPLGCVGQALERIDFLTVAEEPIRQLWRQINCLVVLGVPDDDRVVCVRKIDADRPIHITAVVGKRYPLHSSATGKCCLAYGPAGLLDRIVGQGPERFTPRTITEGKKLEKHLEEICRQGFATDIEESADGLLCLAAPVFNHRKELEGAVGISSLTIHHTPNIFVEQLAEPVIQTARKISQGLGYPME